MKCTQPVLFTWLWFNLGNMIAYFLGGDAKIALLSVMLTSVFAVLVIINTHLGNNNDNN